MAIHNINNRYECISVDKVNGHTVEIIILDKDEGKIRVERIK